MRSIPTSSLPAILALNANVQSEEIMDLWLDNRKQTFLKPRVTLHGQVNGIDDPESVVYELRVRCFCSMLSPSSNDTLICGSVDGDQSRFEK